MAVLFAKPDPAKAYKIQIKWPTTLSDDGKPFAPVAVLTIEASSRFQALMNLRKLDVLQLNDGDSFLQVCTALEFKFLEEKEI